MKKRKFLVVLLAMVATLCMAFGLAGCDEKPDETGKNPPITDPSGGDQDNQGGTTPSAKEYTITYNANGGSFADGKDTYTQTVKEGTKLTAPTSPTRSNYTFAGWAKSKNGSTMWKFDEDTLSETTTLYAQWTQESAIILSVEGASIEDREIFMLVDHTTGEVSLSSKVLCSDDSIWRLYSDPEGQREIPTKMVTNLKNGDNKYYIVVNSQNQARVNLYELIVHRSYLVNVAYYNGDSLLETAEIYTGEKFTASYKPDITGYTFNGWKTKDGINFASDVLWGPLALYADKTAKTYKVTFDVNGGDELTETEKMVVYDSEYSFPVPKLTGYSFTGWYLGSTQVTDTNGKCLAVWKFTKEQKFTANWEANKYKVTLTVTEKGAGTVTGGGEHVYDSQVTITASTNNGFTWLGWYKGEEKISSDFSYQFKMEFSVTYTAKWIKCPVKVTKDVSTGGTVSGVEKTIAGKETTITAKTNDGYTWLGWYQGETELTREFTYQFIMPDSVAGAVTYTAKWIKCPITVQSSDTTIGTVSRLPSTTVIGQKITIEATSSVRLGCEWLGWYNGENKLTEAFTFTFGLEQETLNLIAKYQVKAEMQNFNFTSTETTCTITGVKSKEFTELMVPKCVTAIQSSAFKGCSGLQSVIWNAENCIEARSIFEDCTNLSSVAFGENVKTIPASAFSGCSGLTSITIPDSVTEIGYDAFSGCSGLTSIDIPNSVTSIGNSAFMKCVGLTSITIPASVNFIAGMLFYDCTSLEKIRVAPGNKTYHSENNCLIETKSKTLIAGCKTSKIPDNGSVNSIRYDAFSGCSGLTSINIPNSVTSIGERAFNRHGDTAKELKNLLKQTLSRA